MRTGSSVIVDGHVGSLRYLIEPDMAIVEIWVNKAVSEELLASIRQAVVSGEHGA